MKSVGDRKISGEEQRKHKTHLGRREQITEQGQKHEPRQITKKKK